MAVAHRVYAEALLEAAQEQGRVDKVRGELGEFVAAVESSPELRSLLRNPQIEPHVKRDALAAALVEADPLVGTSCGCSPRRAGSARSARSTPSSSG